MGISFWVVCRDFPPERTEPESKLPRTGTAVDWNFYTEEQDTLDGRVLPYHRELFHHFVCLKEPQKGILDSGD